MGFRVELFELAGGQDPGDSPVLLELVEVALHLCHLCAQPLVLLLQPLLFDAGGHDVTEDLHQEQVTLAQIALGLVADRAEGSVHRAVGEVDRNADIRADRRELRQGKVAQLFVLGGVRNDLWDRAHDHPLAIGAVEGVAVALGHVEAGAVAGDAAEDLLVSDELGHVAEVHAQDLACDLECVVDPPGR